jgi:acetylornithine deacetylase/succinyl-diaminopimelate desuccinylase
VTRHAKDKAEVVTLTEDLIRIESHAEAPGREAEVVRFLAGWFRERGIESELEPVEGKRANLLARVGRSEGKRLLLCGHLDTVPAGSMKDSFSPRVEKGILRGRGACDMKGAVAAMACALVALRGAPLRGEVVFGGTVGEETGSIGVRELVARGPHADFAVVGEPTALRLGLAHKGLAFIRITLTGRAAHGSVPHQGANAALAAARLALEIERELGAKLAARSHPLLGKGTVCVGKISGGTRPNIVPDRCEVEIDCRTLPGGRDLLAEVERIAERVCAEVRGVSAQVALMEECSIVPHVPLETPPSSPVARAAADALATLGLDPTPVGLTYWTDGAHLAATGTETIILGPGDIALAHGPDDAVPVSELVQAARIYADLARRLLG